MNNFLFFLLSSLSVFLLKIICSAAFILNTLFSSSWSKNQRITYNSHTCISCTVAINFPMLINTFHPPIPLKCSRANSCIQSYLEETCWQWRHLLFLSGSASSATSAYVGDLARWGDRGGLSLLHCHHFHHWIGNGYGDAQTRVWWAVWSTTRNGLCLDKCMQYIHLDKPITSLSVFSSLLCQRKFFRAVVVTL